MTTSLLTYVSRLLEHFHFRSWVWTIYRRAIIRDNRSQRCLQGYWHSLLHLHCGFGTKSELRQFASLSVSGRSRWRALHLYYRRHNSRSIPRVLTSEHYDCSSDSWFCWRLNGTSHRRVCCSVQRLALDSMGSPDGGRSLPRADSSNARDVREGNSQTSGR